MKNTNVSISMVGVMCALACGACGQSADALSADGLSNELGNRRGASAGSAAPHSARGADTALSAAHGGDCDAGAVDGGSVATETDAARPGETRSGSRRQQKRRRRGSAGNGGAAAEQPSAGSDAAPPDASTQEPNEQEPETDQPETDQPETDQPGDASPDVDAPAPEVPATPSEPSQPFRLSPGMSWQIQLTGDIDTSVDAQVFDLDLFETSASDIAQLHAAGRKVICYFDTAYESYRPDSAQLDPYRGNPISGWPGQYWIDIREPAVMEVMTARIALAQSKGCDAVDADDVDSRSNDPGFPISAADQRSFVAQLSAAAHARGMAFGLKNALEDLSALMDSADFSVNEECFEYDECELLSPMIAAGKPVFQIEYAEGSLQSRADEVCARANAMGFDTLIKRLDLDAERLSCR